MHSTLHCTDHAQLLELCVAEVARRQQLARHVQPLRLPPGRKCNVITTYRHTHSSGQMVT